MGVEGKDLSNCSLLRQTDSSTSRGMDGGCLLAGISGDARSILRTLNTSCASVNRSTAISKVLSSCSIRSEMEGFQSESDYDVMPMKDR